MPRAKAVVFTRLADGTLLRRRSDGTFRPVEDKTDHRRLAAMTAAQIEMMAASETDHSALDQSFWEHVERPPGKEAISIKLDEDVLAFFRQNGRGYQTRINAVLRRYMQGQRKTG